MVPPKSVASTAKGSVPDKDDAPPSSSQNNQGYTQPDSSNDDDEPSDDEPSDDGHGEPDGGDDGDDSDDDDEDDGSESSEEENAVCQECRFNQLRNMALALVIKNGFKFPEVPENRREVAEMLMKLEPLVKQLKVKHTEMALLTGNPFVAYATNEATNETKEIAITPRDSILKLKKNSLVRFGLPMVSVNQRMWFLKNGVNGEEPLQENMNRKMVKNWLPRTPLLSFSVRGQGGGARGVRKEKVDKKKRLQTTWRMSRATRFSMTVALLSAAS